MIELGATKLEACRMNSSRFTTQSAMFVVLLFYVWVLVLHVLPGALIDLDQDLHNLDLNVVKDFFEPGALNIALTTIQDLANREFERYEYLDQKANSYLGMLGIALTVLTAIGASNSDKASANQSPDARRLKRFRKITYVMAFAALMSSFFLALVSTQVATNSEASYLGFRVAERYDLDPVILEPIPLGHRQPVTEPPREPIGIGSYTTQNTPNNKKNNTGDCCSVSMWTSTGKTLRRTRSKRIICRVLNQQHLWQE
jgi:hypothetical protein